MMKLQDLFWCCRYNLHAGEAVYQQSWPFYINSITRQDHNIMAPLRGSALRRLPKQRLDAID